MTATLASLQTRCERITRRYEAAFGIAPGEDWLAMKLQEELGEFIQAYLAASARSRRRLDEGEAKVAMAQELADVIGFALAMAERLGIDAGAALEAKWMRHEAAS